MDRKVIAFLIGVALIIAGLVSIPYLVSRSSNNYAFVEDGFVIMAEPNGYSGHFDYFEKPGEYQELKVWDATHTMTHFVDINGDDEVDIILVYSRANYTLEEHYIRETGGSKMFTAADETLQSAKNKSREKLETNEN